MNARGNRAITAHMLKLETGEFELGSIHSLDLSNMGIQDLSIVGQCTGLLYLNLSSNNITSLTQLGNLKLLEMLDLSSNKISSLNGMENLTNLGSVNLASNMVMSIDELQCLSDLENLTKLRLQDFVRKQSNPVCQSTKDYKKRVQEILPNLKVLDGELLTGSGSELYAICDEMEAILQEHDEAPGDPLAFKTVPWDIEKLCEPSKTLNRSEEEAKRGFEEVLSHCRKINEEALKSVKDANEALWSPTQT
ncbi:leucine-rich repeat-containing protein 61 [Nematostella vectensis]|uniref:leucine-rich repeat-containing protein 61 n=1 Tax=Nematostella vectensis TaxID=45351 RepID=UPI00138FF777|nr:leucine-rich repeat-containing protein 61 [Nematostella vectensis]